MLILTFFLCYRYQEVFVTFSCTVVGIVVRMKDDMCQIVVGKRKKEIVGEQLLPPSKIVPSELKPFKGDIQLFTTTHDIHLRMFPLQSDKDICVLASGKAGNCEMFEGRELWTHFRIMVMDITVMDITRPRDNLEVSENLYFVKLLVFFFILTNHKSLCTSDGDPTVLNKVALI